MQGQRRVIGRYEVREVLGRGGFAAVYRAYDSVLDRDVALKVLHPHLATESDVRGRFVREGRALARVRHPNVVHVYDAGEAEDTAYIAMELIEGRSLSTLVIERGPLALADVLTVVDQVAAALAALHARNLVHRDVKPPNILIEDDTARAVLLDFGGARSMDISTVTSSAWLVGTPGFMAPDQVEPGGLATPQTDVYQFGATVYSLLTGHPPFEGEATQVIYAIVHLPPPDPRTLRPEVPAAVATVLMESMAKDPARRPKDPLDFAARLRAAAGSGIDTPSPPFVLAPRRTERAAPAPPSPLPPEPKLTPVDSAVTRAMAPPPSPVRRPDAGAPVSPRPVTPRRRGGPFLPLALAGALVLVGTIAGGAFLLGRGDDNGGQTRTVTTTPAATARAQGEAPAVTPAATLVPSPPPAAATPAPSPPPAATASPTPAASPTAAPTPTPEPSRSPTPAPTPSPTPAPAPSPTPVPGVSPAVAERVLRSTMTNAGYAVPDGVVIVPATAGGGVLAAARGVRQPCTDNFCQFVFFVWNDRYLGTDTRNPSRVIRSVAGAGTGRISVTYEGYTRTDPAFFPSLPPMTVTFTCTEARCTPDPWPPPGHEQE